MAQRYETTIRFEAFRSLDTLPAEIIVRGAEMIIDLPKHADSPRFLVRGKPVPPGLYWSGKNEAHEPTRPVSATWSLQGTAYVGIWIEEGYSYFFTFPAC
jgi:hypothetical protein